MSPDELKRGLEAGMLGGPCEVFHTLGTFTTVISVVIVSLSYYKYL